MTPFVVIKHKDHEKNNSHSDGLRHRRLTNRTSGSGGV